MTLSRALLSEALRLARSPLTAVHLVCGLAAGLACGEYFSVTRWDPALGADAYAQFLGALMPLMSAIVLSLIHIYLRYLPARVARQVVVALGMVEDLSLIHILIVGVAVLIPASLSDFLEGVNDNQLGVRVFPDELLSLIHI